MVNIYRVLTGHTHAGSPYETSDSCGNCDGARCNRCKERWEVRYFDQAGEEHYRRFETKEEAQEFVKTWENS